MKAFKSEKRAATAGGGLPIRTGYLNRVGLDNRVSEKKAINRTSAGLRDALFDAIEKVRDGDMIAEDAKAISGLAAQICNTVQLEISVAKLRTEYPADSKLVLPSPLPLGTPEIDPEKK